MLNSIFHFMHRHPRPVFAVLVVGVMISVRVAWGNHVSKILMYSAMPFQQRQIPLSDSELNIPDVINDSDPYQWYIKADKELVVRRDSFMLYGTREEEDDEQIESESSDKKVRAFELIAKGNELYRDRMNRFQPLIGDPDITPRRLGEVLSESAAQLSEHNQPLMALDKINDLERIIHSVQQRQPSETTFNNIVSPTHDMLTAIHTLAPTLKAAELDITRKPIEALARQLLDDSQVLQFTQYWEYTLETNDRFAIEQTAFLKPYYQASIIASRKAMAPRLDEGNAPELAIVGNAAGGNPKLLSLLSERRMAGVNLACQLYRMDHAEKYPDSLEKLVPKYIPAVPDNLVLRNGEKIRLVSIKNHLGGERPILFFDDAKLSENYNFKPTQDPHYNDSCSCISRKYRDISTFPKAISEKSGL